KKREVSVYVRRNTVSPFSAIFMTPAEDKTLYGGSGHCLIIGVIKPPLRKWFISPGFPGPSIVECAPPATIALTIVSFGAAISTMKVVVASVNSSKDQPTII